MPFDSSEFHLPLRRVLVGLIIILLPITIFGLYIGLQASQQVQQMDGAYFRAITQASAVITSNYIAERVAELVQIANEQNVQQAVVSASRSYERMNDTEIRAKAEQEEARWSSPDSDPLVKSILGSELANSIRRHRELNPKLLKITVVGQAGAAVAATDKPMRYFQTESEYWRALSTGGQKSVYISDVRFDDQSRAQYVSISVPVFQEGTNRFIGAITALVDLTPLFAFLNQMQIGRTGRIFVVNTDGTVIAAPGIASEERVRSEEYGAVRDALGTLQGREAGYLHATLSNGQKYLIGFADTGLKATYPNLNWIIVASQDSREAEGNVRDMAIFAMGITAFAFIMLSVLGAYVFLHRWQRLEDLEEVMEHEKKQSASV